MTIEEMRKRLIELCNEYGDRDECEKCPVKNLNFANCLFENYLPFQIETAYNHVFGGKEEINHPDRYASGKFECIDVMLDVFGADAVKHFCILNAFKYLWRSEKKNGVEDIRKAVWYLNKYIELGGDKNER